MEVSPVEISEIEDSASEVRRQMAGQLRNTFLDYNTLADCLEENALKGSVLVVRAAGKEAQALDDSQADIVLEEYCGEKMRGLMIESSRRFDEVKAWSAGVSSLHKKRGHIETRREKGDTSKSAFEDLLGIRFDSSNIGNVQQMAEDLITDIMQNPSTVIVRDKTVDVVNKTGQGIRIDRGEQLREGVPRAPSFTGFVDSSFVARPVKAVDKAKIEAQARQVKAAA